MQLNTTEKHLQVDSAAVTLVEILRNNEQTLGLEESQIYFDFPLYKDLDGSVVASKILIVSTLHGVIAVGTTDVSRRNELLQKIEQSDTDTGKVFDNLYSRLIRNSRLKRNRTELLFPAEVIIFAPFAQSLAQAQTSSGTIVLNTERNLLEHLQSVKLNERIQPDVFLELTSTIEGAKGLIRPKTRDISNKPSNSKGVLVSALEAEIASFDQKQKYGYMGILDGVQRIRGLAGSGKTVVLSMKAALMHLRYPEANILYTFSTRSLYQHIQRMVTRFYRQFDDRDPDWTKLKIMHAWGGASSEGVYYNTCKIYGVEPLSYSTAAAAARSTKFDPFGYACKQLLDTVQIKPMFDYVFVDEGQDFSNSFLKLCVQLVKDSCMVYAYDELQTIFQIKAPSPSDFLQAGSTLGDDTVLYKCYRNPREILVCAHALGFGLYGTKIVQLLENKEHWEDVGYRVQNGDFTEGSETMIERPIENSLAIISNALPRDKIVRCVVYEKFDDEVHEVANSIRSDLEEGLLPEDILVVVADDMNARAYLGNIAQLLAQFEIKTNNIHEDVFSIRNFQREGHVTLSTVHKAKGNEAFVVYIMGVDALFANSGGVRERNMLFTAMTRAKGWVIVSGIGQAAQICQNEINTALENFPYLKFVYPSKNQLKVMKRDLAESAIRKRQIEQMLDEIMKDMTPQEIKQFMEQRSIKKG